MSDVPEIKTIDELEAWLKPRSLDLLVSAHEPGEKWQVGLVFPNKLGSIEEEVKGEGDSLGDAIRDAVKEWGQ